MRRIAVDIDGTVIESLPSDQIFEAKPIQHIIDLVNQLYDQGNFIIAYTARGQKRLKDRIHEIPFEYMEKTKQQLDSIGLKYHTIIFGKIDYDLNLCDKSFNPLTDLENFKKAAFSENTSETSLMPSPAPSDKL